MSKPVRRFAAIIAAAALAVSMSACTRAGWVSDAPPAAGVQTEQDGYKLRNIVVVADESGQAILLGGLHSRDDAAEVTGITVAAEEGYETYGEPVDLGFTASIPRGTSVYLDGSETSFSNPELTPGRLAEVVVTFDGATQLSVHTPVMSAEHEDFAESFSTAAG
ncbi:hypothetical protein GCM10025789_03090 [Tessaracoccus lubricantis]|uniref:Uncharacterized protein n=1 Tax=Tessaracoccus lubricantis TaxID=545543 RepID=A0ABP9F528_9ACTN